MFFDTHAHYDDERYAEDVDALLSSMPNSGVSLIMNASSSIAAARRGLELADAYPFVYSAVGVHPHDAKDMDDASIDTMTRLLEHPKAVAVGEIGLDYYYDLSPREVQRQRFREQLELARAVKLPVIIHERDARDEVFAIIRDYRDLNGVVHCYSGDWEHAKRILDLGWSISFTGVITFKSARGALETVRNMPSDRIMLETDAPYLSPEPVRGGRNDSRNLAYIARKVAETRGVSVEELAQLTMDNGKRFFGI
ncbi:MAG: TatD family hydrolase [Oscillospiraceae bacterium]|jgi:TatD DNase family protein|nr:TatD family hydrolase [Oscillospiraceae bacterium]